ncbi:MAG: hypothetical protein ACQERC_00685 [Bacteroidota bacterium]
MKTKKQMITSVLILLGGCFGALGAFQLQKAGVSAVVASCIIGLLGALIGRLMQSDDLSMVIFAGSFVGMTAISLTTIPIILLAGISCGILYLIAAPIFVGYGGKLGTIAFISVSVIFLFSWIFGKHAG